jgi:hypothetical protein
MTFAKNDKLRHFDEHRSAECHYGPWLAQGD